MTATRSPHQEPTAIVARLIGMTTTVKRKASETALVLEIHQMIGKSEKCLEGSALKRTKKTSKGQRSVTRLLLGVCCIEKLR